MNREKGFTLTEILITFLVIAVVASIAIPGFSNARKKAAANQAIAYLRTIRTAEKMYYAKWKSYYAYSGSAAIKTGLSAETASADYVFSVAAPIVAPATVATTFSAMARKGSTAPTNCTDSDTICVDQDGAWTGASSYKPAS